MVDDSQQDATTSPRPITLAVDAMGGNNAPEDVVAAVAEASAEPHPDETVFFTLVGDEAELTDVLVEFGHNPERIRIHHAPQVIGLHESAHSALERTENSSIEAACRLVDSGHADAVVTAGHPGAAVLAGKRYFDRIPGVRKTALCAVYPTPRERGPNDDRFSLILDVGAGHRADPEDLHGFGLMGSAYSRLVSGLEHPRVALLSTSSEVGSGPPHIARAAERLGDDPRITFHGNYEGHDVPTGVADVIVCDGYVGNVTIKILEGVSEAAFDLAQAAYNQRLVWKLGLRLLSGGLSQLKRMTDFEEYGGAPVLGLERVMIVAHTRSRRKAFGNALRLAIKNAKSRLPERIGELVSE